MNKLIKTALLSSSVAVLAACGGSGDGESAQLTLAVSDNPANVKEAVIAFKSVAVKQVLSLGEPDEDQPEHHIAVQDNNGENSEYRQIDLKQFQGSNAAELFTDITLEPGDYQMCIYISNGSGSQDVDDSYVVEDDDDIKGLRTPSNGSCAGFKPDDQQNTGRLKTTTFTIHEGKNYLVAEFDLMKVLKQPVGNKEYWTLKPTGYELVHATDVGSIEGLVAEDVISSCADDDISMAYLYPGTVALENMGDFRGDLAQDADMIAPTASALVNADEIVENGIEYKYEFGFVKEGSYSIGYTCTDDPDIAEDGVIAAAIQNVVVLPEETTQAETIETAPGE